MCESDLFKRVIEQQILLQEGLAVAFEKSEKHELVLVIRGIQDGLRAALFLHENLTNAGRRPEPHSTNPFQPGERIVRPQSFEEAFGKDVGESK